MQEGLRCRLGVQAASGYAAAGCAGAARQRGGMGVRVAHFLDTQQRKTTLATPNYGYEKRQRELAKKNKKAEKLREKAERKTHPAMEEGAEPEPAAAQALPPAQPPTLSQ